MRFKKCRHRYEASPVIHGFAPSRLRGALDTGVEHYAGFPRLFESPRELMGGKGSGDKGGRFTRRVECRDDERRNRLRIDLRPSGGPIRLDVQGRVDLDLPDDLEHLIEGKYDAFSAHAPMLAAFRQK